MRYLLALLCISGCTTPCTQQAVDTQVKKECPLSEHVEGDKYRFDYKQFNCYQKVAQRICGESK